MVQELQLYRAFLTHFTRYDRMPTSKKIRQRQKAIHRSTGAAINDSDVYRKYFAAPRGILGVVCFAFFFTVVTSPAFHAFISVSTVQTLWLPVASSPSSLQKQNQSDKQGKQNRLKFFAQAMDRVDSKEYKEALALFDKSSKAIGNVPSNDLLHTEWGHTLRSLGNIDGAVKHYEKAIDHNERSFSALGALAEIFHDRTDSSFKSKSVGLLAYLFDMRHACEPHRNVGKKNENRDIPSYCVDVKENKDEFAIVMRRAYMLRAEIFFENEDFEYCLGYLKLAQKIVTQNIRGDTDDINLKFGLVYEKLERFRLAYAHYRECRQSVRLCQQRINFLKKVGREAGKMVQEEGESSGKI